jgi:hypothetical protein
MKLLERRFYTINVYVGNNGNTTWYLFKYIGPLIEALEMSNLDGNPATLHPVKRGSEHRFECFCVRILFYSEQVVHK